MNLFANICVNNSISTKRQYPSCIPHGLPLLRFFIFFFHSRHWIGKKGLMHKINKSVLYRSEFHNDTRRESKRAQARTHTLTHIARQGKNVKCLWKRMNAIWKWTSERLEWGVRFVIHFSVSVLKSFLYVRLCRCISFLCVNFNSCHLDKI